MDIEKIILTSRETCSFYSITKTTLQNWVAKGFPRSKRNEYSLLAGFRWWRRNVVGEESGDLQIEKLKYQKARTRREELRVQQEEGALLPREVSIRWLTRLLTEARMGFLNLPKRLCQELATLTDFREIEGILRKEIRQILTDLSEGGKAEVKKMKGGK